MSTKKGKDKPGEETGSTAKASRRAKAGRSFLDYFEEPELPFFLLEASRHYASKYLEWPERQWPKWLRLDGETEPS